MLALLLLLIVALLLPMVFAIVIARLRPHWSFFKVALIAGSPVPVLLGVLSLVFVRIAQPQDVYIFAGVILTSFVCGVIVGAVGAWMTPRPRLPLTSTNDLEDLFS